MSKIEQVKEILKKMGASDVGICEDTVIKDLPKWDSLKYLSFLLEVETVFNIEVEPEDIQSIKTIKDLIQIL